MPEVIAVTLGGSQPAGGAGNCAVTALGHQRAPCAQLVCCESGEGVELGASRKVGTAASQLALPDPARRPHRPRASRAAHREGPELLGNIRSDSI